MEHLRHIPAAPSVAFHERAPDTLGMDDLQATRGSSRSDGDGNWMMDGGLQGEHSWRDEALAHARPQMGMRPAPHAADVDVDAS
ncbi:HDA13 [Auxenochlorella protothecoides x Auxenochlorella symbiontica]